MNKVNMSYLGNFITFWRINVCQWIRILWFRNNVSEQINLNSTTNYTTCHGDNHAGAFSMRFKTVKYEKRTKVKDIRTRLAKLTMCRTYRTKRILKWDLEKTKRRRGRPQKCWTEDIQETAESNWIQKAQDRGSWTFLKSSSRSFFC